MDQNRFAIDLGAQLAVAAGFIVLMVVIHSLGLVGISKLLRLEKDRLLRHDFDFSAILLLAGFGLLLFMLHIAEIVLFALFYWSLGVIGGLEGALFYSASAYATLGWTADAFPVQWRLIGALEALIGFILIGWSTAFMINTMQNLTDSEPL